MTTDPFAPDVEDLQDVEDSPPRLLSPKELDAIEDWAVAHADADVAGHVQDLIDHAEVLADLIRADGDPPRSAVKRHNLQLAFLRDRFGRKIKSDPRGGTDGDRAFYSALDHAVTVIGRQVELTLGRRQ